MTDEAGMRPGPRNLITDVAGLRVGNAQDEKVASGATVLTADAPFVTGVHVMGGAPGSRETDLLAPDKLVQEANALVLSGGSALGLSAASGVADAMRAAGQGFDVGGQKVPIVPAAILFDLLNGGDKGWAENPYPALGAAALAAADKTFDLGSVGAGRGATTANLAGGLGSASAVLPNGMTVGALVDGMPFVYSTPYMITVMEVVPTKYLLAAIGHNSDYFFVWDASENFAGKECDLVMHEYLDSPITAIVHLKHHGKGETEYAALSDAKG